MAKVTGAIRHTHRYYKHYDQKGNVTWRCLRDGCTHFLPRNVGEPFGMKSICWGSNDENLHELILTYDKLKMDKPRCDACSNQLSIISQFLEEKMPETDPVMRAFDKAAEKAGVQIKHEEVKQEEPMDDMIEVYEPEHRADCNVFSGGECNCM